MMSQFPANHSECPRGIDAGAYVLGALTADEAGDFGEHLAGCTHCHSEVQELRLVVDTLPIAATQIAAPPALKGRLMAVVNAEAELLRAAGPEADRVVDAPKRRRRWLPSFANPLRPAFVWAIACALLAVGVIGGIALDSSGGPDTRTVNAQTTGGAKAKIVLTGGKKAELQVTGARSLKAGRVYQVWFVRGDRQKRPTRTSFNVPPDGRTNVAIDGSVKGVKRVLVTEEPGPGSLAPSSPPIISADLA